MPKRGNAHTTVLERGDIFFLYRPRVNEDEPAGLSDVQRFFVALRPEGGERLRLLAVGRKRLPDADRHERNWGFVAKVSRSAGAIERELEERLYETRTRGERREPAARPAGEGVYAITLTGGQMHLSYVLELPKQPDEVQRAFKIAPEASFVLSVKNPEKPAPPALGLRPEQEAEYPDRLQREFRDRRFASEDVRLLDFEGAEFILVGARTDPEHAYCLDMGAEEEDERSADVLRQLRMTRSQHPVRPLFEGKWA